MKNRKAFTLIEILAVVAIIGLLIAILLPSLSKAKTQARRATCASQLHQVGLAMMAYMQDNRDRMPFISAMPSIGPFPLETARPVTMGDVLKRHLKGNMNALHCPEDKPDNPYLNEPRPAPNAGRSYFETEQSSYEYRFPLAGLTPTEFNNREARFGGVGRRPHWHHNQDAQKNIAPNTIYFARDYNNFHAPSGQQGSRRYVYIDGHVSDYEN